ncbi:MAG: AbrB/MazE/SpoVT family DNA-binding domain-containing protein [Patescibacteria group bacterium]
MPTRKLEDKNIRKLTRIGRSGASLGLTLPKEMVKELGWRERQRVVVKRIKGGLVIRDYHNKK